MYCLTHVSWTVDSRARILWNSYGHFSSRITGLGAFKGVACRGVPGLVGFYAQWFRRCWDVSSSASMRLPKDLLGCPLWQYLQIQSPVLYGDSRLFKASELLWAFHSHQNSDCADLSSVVFSGNVMILTFSSGSLPQAIISIIGSFDSRV